SRGPTATGSSARCPASRPPRCTAVPAATRRSSPASRTWWCGPSRPTAPKVAGTGTIRAGSAARAGRGFTAEEPMTASSRGDDPPNPPEITASTVLAARREPITLRTADGLALVGELAVPQTRPPVATLVCLHPLPTAGGMMDSHILRKAAYRLPALADLAVLRFNTRGTTSERGTSEGEFGGGETERHDVAAAIDFAVTGTCPCAGWSAGRSAPSWRCAGAAT